MRGGVEQVVLRVRGNYGTGRRGGNLVNIQTEVYSTWEARSYIYGELCKVVAWRGKEYARGRITMPQSGQPDKDMEQGGVGQGRDMEF